MTTYRLTNEELLATADPSEITCRNCRHWQDNNTLNYKGILYAVCDERETYVVDANNDDDLVDDSLGLIASDGHCDGFSPTRDFLEELQNAQDVKATERWLSGGRY